MGAGRLITLVMGFGSFRTDCYGWIIGWRSKHHTEAGSFLYPVAGDRNMRS
jgi:hypothetical protein